LSTGILDDMRLVVNAPYDLTNNDGITHYLLNLVPRLAALCDLTMLTPFPEMVHGSCRTIRIPRWTSSRYGRLAWTLFFAPRHFSGCDAVFCPTSEAPRQGAVPYIATVHDLTPLVLRHLYPARKKLPILPAAYTLRWASLVVADSRSTKLDLVTRGLVGSHRVHVVPLAPGVAAGAPSECPPFPWPYVLYVGGYGQNKNVHRLLRAFAGLNGQPNLGLVVVGWGESQSVAAARRLVEKLDLSERVQLLRNRFSDSELSSFYAHCGAFVYPSLHEGFGLPVLEAMAHGAPTACSNVASLPEVGGDAVLYFDPHSVSDIAAAIKRLLSDQPLRARLQRAGPARAARFTWERTAESVVRIAAGLVRERSERPARRK
jgi:glycosyltransferase involved in cell wall biosynthesis